MLLSIDDGTANQELLPGTLDLLIVRYYVLTRAGRKQLALKREQFQTMIGAIQKVLA
jgi:DNA-binding PadR family transcriptional regulator